MGVKEIINYKIPFKKKKKKEILIAFFIAKMSCEKNVWQIFHFRENVKSFDKFFKIY